MEFNRIIKKTGINSDYANEFITCRCLAKKYMEEPETAYEHIKDYQKHFKKYTEREPGKKYIPTKKNKKQLIFLDRIVDELNSMLEDPKTFDCKRVETLAERAFVLIYGEREEDYQKRVKEFLSYF